MAEEATSFKPFQVGWSTVEQFGANLAEAVQAEQERVIRLRDYLAGYIIAWHIDKYNQRKPNLPYWEWVTQSFDTGFIGPWLDTGRFGVNLRRTVGLLFVTNVYADEWRSEWATSDMAQRITEQYHIIGRMSEGGVPEFADLAAEAVPNSHNIVISYKGRSFRDN